MNERQKGVLNKQREKLDIKDARDQENDQDVEKKNDREIYRDTDRDPGVSH